MKTTLLFTALMAACLSANAQSALAKPEIMDSVRVGKYDLNRDGKLDPFEQEVERQTREADRSQQIARGEQALQAIATQKLQFDLEKFDTNKDGALDDTEKTTRNQWYADRRKEFLAKYDKNGDGKVTADELNQGTK